MNDNVVKLLNMRKGKIKKCITCKKEFYIPPCWVGNRGKFCCRKCYFKYINALLK